MTRNTILREAFESHESSESPKVHTNFIGGRSLILFTGQDRVTTSFRDKGNDYFDGDDGENIVFRGVSSEYQITEAGWNTFKVLTKRAAEIARILSLMLLL